MSWMQDGNKWMCHDGLRAVNSRMEIYGNNSSLGVSSVVPDNRQKWLQCGGFSEKNKAGETFSLLFPVPQLCWRPC